MIAANAAANKRSTIIPVQTELATYQRISSTWLGKVAFIAVKFIAPKVTLANTKLKKTLHWMFPDFQRSHLFDADGDLGLTDP
jgi:hypothetical protein